MSDMMINTNFHNTITDQSLIIPAEKDFIIWVQKSWLQKDKDTCVDINIINRQESQRLNSQYLNKDKPTNVLAFPEFPIPGETVHRLGELYFCAQVVCEEALSAQLDSQSHWAHLCIHGMLHLQGYDHIHTDDAEKMENLEVKLLKDLGIPNPYLIKPN